MVQWLLTQVRKQATGVRFPCAAKHEICFDEVCVQNQCWEHKLLKYFAKNLEKYYSFMK